MEVFHEYGALSERGAVLDSKTQNAPLCPLAPASLHQKVRCVVKSLFLAAVLFLASLIGCARSADTERASDPVSSTIAPEDVGFNPARHFHPGESNKIVAFVKANPEIRAALKPYEEHVVITVISNITADKKLNLWYPERAAWVSFETMTNIEPPKALGAFVHLKNWQVVSVIPK